jgi:hypothetical protein
VRTYVMRLFYGIDQDIRYVLRGFASGRRYELDVPCVNATYVWFDPYISPTVAPPVFTPASGYPGLVPVDHAWYGAFPAWEPTSLPQSPAFFLRALAIAFRPTCYYYRVPRRVLHFNVDRAQPPRGRSQCPRNAR